MNKATIILLFTITLYGCKPEKNKLTFEQQQVQAIANANGVKAWDSISEISFTFNVDRNGNNIVARHWQWNPKTDAITHRYNGTYTQYNRKQLDSTLLKIDASFINDKYWLLAPFNILWDKNTTITITKDQIAPIAKHKQTKLTLVYGDEGGYTPGDAYDFYYGDDYQITEWVFRKSNQSKPSLMTTWENYQEYNGIKISQTHYSEKGDFKLYFSNIEVN